MTAVQELIDWAISLQYNHQQCTDWIVIKDKAESLLELEKQQILDAFEEGSSDGFYGWGSSNKEHYYTSTYGSKGSETKQ